MHMKIIHKIKYKIPQRVSELCDNSKNFKIVVKIGLERFFNFEYYFSIIFRHLEITQFNIIHFYHFQKKGWVFYEKGIFPIVKR